MDMSTMTDEVNIIFKFVPRIETIPTELYIPVDSDDTTILMRWNDDLQLSILEKADCQCTIHFLEIALGADATNGLRSGPRKRRENVVTGRPPDLDEQQRSLARPR